MKQRFFAPFLIAGIFLLCSLNNASAQGQVYGPEVLCLGECGTWGYEGGDPADAYQWQIWVDQPGPNNMPIYETSTDTNFLTWCPDFLGPGTYLLWFVLTDLDGNILFEGEVFLSIFDNFNTTSYAEIVGSYNSSCVEFDSIYTFASPEVEHPCFDVCVGSYSNLFLEQVYISDQTGQTIWLEPGQGTWSVIGVDATVTQSQWGVSIVWESAGTAQIIFGYWYDSWNGCQGYGEIIFCAEVSPAPEAEFSTDPPPNANGILEICEGQTVYFTNESADAETFQWNFGDETSSSDENPSHTYTEAGTFEISLATSSSCDCVDTTRMTVIVEGNDAPFVDCVSTICEGESVTYTANTGCTTYTWNVSGNGTITEGGGSADDFITIQWGAGPIGEITLETDGCPDLSTCTEAAYLQVPIISANAIIEGPEQVCLGDHSVYSVTPFEGTSFNWTVSSFGTIISGQGTPSITVEWFDGFIPTNAQSVNVDYENCYLECGGSAQLDVYIRPEFYASGPIEVCENETTNYNTTSTQTNMGFPANFEVLDAAGTVVWTSPGAAATANIPWDFGTGTFTIQVTAATPTDFCTTQYDVDVTVYSEPDPVATVDGQTNICPTIPYTYEVVDVNDGDRFLWTIDDGGLITEREGNTVAVTWLSAGPYSIDVVRQTQPLGCQSAATTITILPVSGFTVSGDDQVCMDQIAPYTSDQTGDVYYDWSILPAGAGTIIEDPTADNIEVLWHDPGNAQVVLDICGQIETFDVFVNAPPEPVVNAPAALCPNATAPISTTTLYSSYSWQDTVGTEISTAAIPDLGPGYYRLEVTDALGCTGYTTFSIYGYPESKISISTPDYNIFCLNPPSTLLYAVNTEDGYTYQWYMDGTPIGTGTTSYTATAFGNYWVEIIDENGCQFASNVISVYMDCDDTRCQGNSGTCPDHDFAVIETGSCDIKNYQALTPAAIPGSASWNFDDADSGGNNIAFGDNVSHEYSKPGFYRILMRADYDDGAGGTFSCAIIKPDTILMVADFDYDGVCSGLPVQFYDLSTFLDLTSITDWTWDFGDPSTGVDNVSSDKDPVHIFSGEGYFDVTLTVTSATGCTATITNSVLIYPAPYTNIPDPTITCAGTALEFVADVEATVSDVTWIFGDSTTGNADTSSLFTSYHAYDTPGNYDVLLESESIYGCPNSTFKTITITPNTLTGEIDPAGLTQICEGDDVTLTGVSATATSYDWSTGSDVNSITVDVAGTYEITFTDVEGCIYTPLPAVVDVIPAPQSPIRAVEYNDFNQPTSATYDTLFICQGEEAFLETDQVVDYSYNWSSGDFDNNTEFSEDRGNILPTGTHDVSLTVTDTNTGCSNVEVFVIVVHPNPATPLLDSGGNTLCAGTTSTISITNFNPVNNYFWSNGEAGSSITTAEAGQYHATAINEFGCVAESEITEIHEGPDISLVPSGCHTRCSPDTICLPTIPNIVSYQWYQDGVIIPDPEGTIPELVITESGSYELEMEDINGCVQTTDPLVLNLLEVMTELAGTVYLDINETMFLETPPDEPTDSVGFFLYDENDMIIDADTTGMDGMFLFENVAQGNYTICIDTTYLPEGWWPYEICQDAIAGGCGEFNEGEPYEWLLGPICPQNITDIFVDVCPGEAFVYETDILTQGIHEYLYITPEGCDSLVYVHVTEFPFTQDFLTLFACPGETTTYQGVVLAVGDTQDFPFIDANGCDGSLLVNVEALPTSTGTETLMACPGETVDYGGVILSVGDVMDFTLTGVNGCDSIVTVTVEALPTNTGAETLMACPGSAVSYGGVNLSIGDIMDFTLTGANGCDSIVTVTVQAATTSNEQIVEAVCAGETFSYQGTAYPGGTDEVFVFSNTQGCDSTVNLIVLELPEAQVDWTATESCPDFGTGTLSVTPITGAQPFVYALDTIGGFQASPDFTDLFGGSYELFIEDSEGCQTSTTVEIPEFESLIVFVEDVIFPCDSTTITLMPEIISGDDGLLQFNWNNGPATLSQVITQPGIYELTVSNGCEVVTVVVNVDAEVKGDEGLIYVPNAFSPNNDGINDEFMLYPGNYVDIDEVDFQIFDRWGSMLFDASSGDDTWNGRRGNQKAAQGVYVWRMEATVNICGQMSTMVKEGEVLLMR